MNQQKDIKPTLINPPNMIRLKTVQQHGHSLNKKPPICFLAKTLYWGWSQQSSQHEEEGGSYKMVSFVLYKGAPVGLLQWRIIYFKTDLCDDDHLNHEARLD